MSWPEVKSYKDQNKHELVLSGVEVDRRISRFDGLDPEIFRLSTLNFLEISSTSLSHLPDDAFADLPNLIHLVLRENKLASVPTSIGRLQKLRSLDLSTNALSRVPDDVNRCAELYSLNLRGNVLEELPPLGRGNLAKLTVLDVSNNGLTELTEDLTCLSLSSLAEIHAQNNRIASIPESVKNLHCLKVLNLENNRLSSLPPQLSLCAKLKEINFKGNQLVDKRLSKMVQSCKTSSIIEYLHKSLPTTDTKSGGASGKKSGSARKKAKARSRSRGENRSRSGSPAPRLSHKIIVLPATESRTVTVSSAALEVRPHILCCVALDVDLRQTNALFKRFIASQTKLHDTVGQKRLVSTIATHDDSALSFPLSYDARDPKDVLLQPLGRAERLSADELIGRLLHEAEEARKKSKRSGFTGIHKYLELVKGKTSFACLLMNEGMENETVVSFPPITNSDVSKISPSTSNVFIEVTSATSLEAAKRTLDALVKDMLLLGLTRGSYDNTFKEDGAAGEDVDAVAASLKNMSVEGKSLQLSLQQVRVVDASTGALRSVYPSNVDLTNLGGEGIQVVRD